MPRHLIPERSSHDRLAILGIRQEMIGWALLFLWAVLWLLRGLPTGQVASRMEAISHIDLNSHGTELQLRQAFDTAQKATAAEASLTLLTGRQIHSSSTFVLHVVADTREQALAGRAAMTKAMEAISPEAQRPFRVEAHPSDFCSKVWNDKMRRVSLTTTALLVLFGSGALMLVLLGSSKQADVRPLTLWMKLAAPLLFLLGNGPWGTGRNYGGPPKHGESLSDSLAPFVMFVFPILAISVVPALFIVWLTRSSGILRGKHKVRETSR